MPLTKAGAVDRLKFRSLTNRVWRRCNRLFGDIPKPTRLTFGALWLRRNDSLGKLLGDVGFEVLEQHFVQRFLQSGMTVLDVGAHHGFYTLLASKCVGHKGRVIAFEPSARERRALRLHTLLNRCGNVLVQGLALGAENGEADLNVVLGHSTGCNSLRPLAHDIYAETRRVRVRIVRLDQWLRSRGIRSVDFIKLDVEGAELDVLRGAGPMLENRPRPVILAEVQDVRTRPWGYEARQIIDYLSSKGYKWFSIAEKGLVIDLEVRRSQFEGNFVACPEESIATLPRV